MLEYLSEQPARTQRAAVLQADVFLARPVSRAPLLLSAELTPEQRQLPSFDLRSIHWDCEKMAARELLNALTAVNGGREAVPSVRANMGCGIVPALFGVRPLLFEDKMPWVKQHLPKEQLREMQPKDLCINDEFQKALDHMEFLAERFKDTGVLVYPLDIQGAFDTAHIVLGDAIFYELYDDAEFVHHLLELSCAAVERAFDACLARMPGSDAIVPHYNSLVMPRALGGLKLSEDTPTLLNRAQIDEFVVPYMHRLLAHAGGGYVHYCGQNPHLYQAVMQEPLAHALNFGNPEKHDMEAVLRDCAAHGKLYYGLCPRQDGESTPAFYRRLLQSAVRDGKLHLLLQDTCALADKNACSDAWDQAYEQVL